MPSIEELKDTHNRASNVRKGLQGLLFVAPMSAEVPDTLFNGDDITIPSGYMPAGLIEKSAGFTVGREADTEDVEALGYGSPVRRDITTGTQTLGVTLIETRAIVRALADGLDISNLPVTSNGEVMWDHPDIPPAVYYRVLKIAGDGGAGSWVYTGEFYPRAMVSEPPEVAHNSSDATQYEITFTGLLDDDAGFSRRSFMGGSGFDAEAAGFRPAGGGGS